MPTYEFFCAKCDSKFEEVQPMGAKKRITIQDLRLNKRSGKCPTCKKVSKERVFSHNVYFVGASVEHAEFNPALGQVVKNSKHRKDLAKEKGLIEIGNEPVDKIHKYGETVRADKLKKSWDDV